MCGVSAVRMCVVCATLDTSLIQTLSYCPVISKLGFMYPLVHIHPLAIISIQLINNSF